MSITRKTYEFISKTCSGNFWVNFDIVWRRLLNPSRSGATSRVISSHQCVLGQVPLFVCLMRCISIIVVICERYLRQSVTTISCAPLLAETSNCFAIAFGCDIGECASHESEYKQISTVKLQ